MNKVIGIILAYNSADLLEHTYAKIPKESLNEIILVDDGSRDATLQISRRLGMPSFEHSHLGYGGNIKFGLAKAIELGGDYMVMIHHDGQYDLSVISEAIQKMKSEHVDYLLGSRFATDQNPLLDGMSIVRYVANRWLSFIDRIILGIRLTEFHTGFRIYSRHLLEVVDFGNTSDGFIFDFEAIVLSRFAKAVIAEIPIRCDYKGKHTSMSLPVSIKYAIQTFWVLFQYLLRRCGLRTRLFEGS